MAVALPIIYLFLNMSGSFLTFFMFLFISDRLSKLNINQNSDSTCDKFQY